MATYGGGLKFITSSNYSASTSTGTGTSVPSGKMWRIGVIRYSGNGSPATLTLSIGGVAVFSSATSGSIGPIVIFPSIDLGPGGGISLSVGGPGNLSAEVQYCEYENSDP